MTVLFRCRVEKPIIDKANEVTREMGTSTAEMFRIFVTQIAKTGRIPLSLDSKMDDPILGQWEHRARTVESFYDESKTW